MKLPKTFLAVNLSDAFTFQEQQQQQSENEGNEGPEGLEMKPAEHGEEESSGPGVEQPGGKPDDETPTAGVAPGVAVVDTPTHTDSSVDTPTAATIADNITLPEAAATTTSVPLSKPEGEGEGEGESLSGYEGGEKLAHQA